MATDNKSKNGAKLSDRGFAPGQLHPKVEADDVNVSAFDANAFNALQAEGGSLPYAEEDLAEALRRTTTLPSGIAFNPRALNPFAPLADSHADDVQARLASIERNPGRGAAPDPAGSGVAMFDGVPPQATPPAQAPAVREAGN